MKHLKLLKRLSIRSNHDTFHHATVVIKGGAIQSFGYNLNATHAEVNALKKLWPSKRAGVTVFNLRFTRRGLGNSRPCKRCMDFMVQNSVANIWFYEDGELKRERV